MAATTALAIASLVSSAYSVGKDLLTKPPKAPAAPAVPPPPAPVDPEPALARRKKALIPGQAAGRSATLLTGPSGLSAPAPVQRKTLLGS